MGKDSKIKIAEKHSKTNISSNNIPTRGILKIFQSFNLFGNKVLNVRVEDATDPLHPVNKQFLDERTTYNTVKANTYQNPFLFPLMRNVYGMQYKPLLDDLLFPRVLPVYINPTVKLIDFCLNNYEQFYKNKWLTLNNKSIIFSLKVEFTNNDRLPSATPYLTINGQNIQPTTYTVTSASFEKISIVLTSSTTFIINRLFLASSIKKDSYGDNYIPSDFMTTYLLTLDLPVQHYILESILVRSQNLNDLPEDITNNDNVPADFIFSNKLYLNSNIEGIFDFMIPVIDMYKYIIHAYIFDNSNAKPLFISDIIIPYDRLFYYGTITMKKNNIDYRYGQFNFGYYQNNIFIVLKLEHINTEIYD
jgi:hypothetical protein